MDVSHQTFKAHLMSISNQLTSDDLNKMKFVLQDDLPKRKLEGVQQPYQLFSLMMEAKLLSANNLTRLAELLKSAGRMDLSNDVFQQVGQQMEVEGPSFFEDHPACFVGALPCKPAHFYGRNDMLDKIVEVLSGSNGQRLVLITGLPGYGKSCLAQIIGHVMIEKGFQVIFLCLREIRYVSKMCANILLSLKVNICGLASKQCELALSHLKSLTTKTILILDNAEDILKKPEERKEFYNFVNHVATYANHVKCVITSREVCSTSCQISRYSVKLLALETEDAARLLQAKVKENTILTLEDDQAKVIADLCLNVPLILHAAAAYIEDVGGPLALIQVLEKHSAPLELADMEELSPDLKMKRFLFDCLQQLGHELEKALVSLAVFPAAFHRDQVFIVFDVSIQLDTVLLSLVKRSLVHRDVETNQYFVHRLIQLCCEEKAQKDELLRVCYNQARERFVEHYLSLITELQRRFLSKGASKETICHYWKEEQHIIQAIFWALKNGSTLSTRCAKVLNNAVVFLAKVMKRRDFENVYSAALAANNGDLRVMVDCLTCVGIKLIFCCECHRTCSVVSEKCYKVLQKALGLYEQLNVQEGELVAQCYSKVARCMAKNGCPTTALELSSKALGIREKTREKEPFKYAACCNDRAVVLSSLQNHKEAMNLREQALVTYIDQLGEHLFTGTLYNYLGNDCLALGNFDKAVEYFSEALRIREALIGSYHHETARTLHDLGVAYKMKGDYENAMEKVNSAITIQEALFDVPHEKLKSLKEKQGICIQLNAPETSIQQLQMKIQECEDEMTQAKQSNNLRLERIMDIINTKAS